MDIQIHAVGFKADQKLIDFAQARVEKLTKFYDQITGGEVFFRLDNTVADENKIVEIKVNIPHNSMFAKKQAKTFEEAVDQACDALKGQIEKVKGKLQDK